MCYLFLAFPTDLGISSSNRPRSFPYNRPRWYPTQFTLTDSINISNLSRIRLVNYPKLNFEQIRVKRCAMGIMPGATRQHIELVKEIEAHITKSVDTFPLTIVDGMQT